MNNSKTIEVLDDDLLTQILVRLPSCASVLVCTAVKKHWRRLITHPTFADQFCNFKKERSLGSDIDDDEPPWTFITHMSDRRERRNAPRFVGNTSNNEAVFGSPKFSMGYLPCAKIKSTFMDLVLCSNTSSSLFYFSPRQDLYITNPFTKQWVGLPPCPTFVNRELLNWVALVCQKPYGYPNQDYKFRVVMINRYPPPVYELVVYCSEIGEWKEFKLSVPINRQLTDYERAPVLDNRFEGAVCNGIIYLYHMLYFAAFNPFDVDETTNTTTIEAKLLPSLPYPVDGHLRESSGKLFIMHNPNISHKLSYIKHGRAIEFPLKVWKLDPNLVPLIWKTTFEGSCMGNLNELEPPSDNTDTDPITNDMQNSHLGMHPNNEKLIYMHLRYERQMIMCDTRIGLIKTSKSMPRYFLEPFHRLALQWWPTSVPKVYLPNASQ